ncbi:MAG TPA: type IV toxin-antitoxin system AbiEi family antitoxin domain-containing protein [Actinomycetota bacterium]
MARLAERQHGVFTRAQLRELGATRGFIDHRLEVGRWERCASGVFRLAGVPPSWRQSLLAACLAWGDGAVASHRAAAALPRLAGFEPGPIELTVPRRRDRIAPGIVHRNALPAGDVTIVEAIPVTVPARTLIDIAAVASRDAVEEALDDALRRRLVSIARMRWHVRGDQRGRPGIAVMRALLEARAPSDPPPESVLESRLLRVLRRARLPEPLPQYRIRSGGRTVAVVDFAFPDARLAIEADSYRWHSGRMPWEHDLARRNALTLLGWRVIHVTWRDLARPERLVAAIWAALHDAP